MYKTDAYKPSCPLCYLNLITVGVLRISAWKCYRYGIIIHPIDTSTTNQRFRWDNYIVFRPRKGRNTAHWKTFVFSQFQPIFLNSIMFTSLRRPKKLLLEIFFYFVVVLDLNSESRPLGKLVVLFSSTTAPYRNTPPNYQQNNLQYLIHFYDWCPLNFLKLFPGGSIDCLKHFLHLFLLKYTQKKVWQLPSVPPVSILIFLTPVVYSTNSQPHYTLVWLNY